MIGILALQGDYAAHGRVLDSLHATWKLVRTAGELDACQGLIIPGGESTTLLKLIDWNKLQEPLQHFYHSKQPIFGTCAGSILIAKHVSNPAQESFGWIDMHIERNAYGRQLNSQVVQGKSQLSSKTIEMVFIRAPRITQCSNGVEVLATYQGEPVCIQQDHCMAATFHPELSQHTLFHQHFLKQVSNVS